MNICYRQIQTCLILSKRSYYCKSLEHGICSPLQEPCSAQFRPVDSNYAQISWIISLLQTSLHSHRIAPSWYGNHYCSTASPSRCHSNIPLACTLSPSSVISSFPPSNAPFCSLGEERQSMFFRERCLQGRRNVHVPLENFTSVFPSLHSGLK